MCLPTAQKEVNMRSLVISVVLTVYSLGLVGCGTKSDSAQKNKSETALVDFLKNVDGRDYRCHFVEIEGSPLGLVTIVDETLSVYFHDSGSNAYHRHSFAADEGANYASV